MKIKDCVFCQIVDNQLPSFKIYEDEKHLAFLSIFPNTDGLSVLIPKRHFSSDFKIAEDEVIAELSKTAKKVAKKIAAAFDDVERCGLVCEGEAVDHLHFKIIPLHGTDKEDFDQPAKLKTHPTFQFFKKYPGYISTLEPTEMAEAGHLEEIARRIKAD